MSGMESFGEESIRRDETDEDSGTSSDVSDSSSEDCEPCHIEAKTIIKNNQKDVSKSPNEGYNATVEVVNPSGNLHLGTQIIFNGPVFIKGISKKDIISLQDKCQCEKKKIKPKSTTRIIFDRIQRMKGRLVERMSVRNCKILATLITLVYFLILYFHYNIYRKPNLIKAKSNTKYITSPLDEVRDDLLSILVGRQQWESEEKSDYKRWYDISVNDYCTYVCNVTVKFKVRFIIMKDIWTSCVNDKPLNQCNEDIFQEFARSVIYFRYYSSIHLFDMYYNYVVGYDGYVYEGRPLTCPFHEPDLVGDHSNIITIGMPFCFGNYLEKDLGESIWLLNTISLLKALEKSGVLDHNFYIEFPSICQHFFKSLNESININNYSFHYNNFYEISSNFDRKVKENLLFLPGDNATTADAMTSIDKINFNTTLMPFEYSCFSEPNKIPSNLTQIAVRIYHTDDLYTDYVPDKLTCKSAVKCSIVLDKVISEWDELRSFIINYVIVIPDNILYKVVNNNCSISFKKDKFTQFDIKEGQLPINILVLYSKYQYKYRGYGIERDDVVVQFSKLTKRIGYDIRRTINYTEFKDSTISFGCTMMGNDRRVSEVSSIITKSYEMFFKYMVHTFGQYHYDNDYGRYICEQHATV